MGNFKSLISPFTIISLVLVFSAATVKEPDGPREPKVLKVEGKKKKVRSEKESSSGTKLSLVLANATTLDGSFQMPKARITVSYKKKGLHFQKKISMGEIKELHILEWKPSRKVQRGPDLFRYYFYPDKWTIKSRKGVEYTYLGNIPPLNRIEISTEYGNTVLFNYFIDYWESTGEKTGFWQNAQEKDFSYPSTHPLEKVIVKIIMPQ